MAFGQQSGPPASSRRVQRLLELLNEAGHTDFRDARGPMGFTQRQAAGKFTVDEAEAFIDRLEQTADGTSSDSGAERVEPVRMTSVERALREFDDADLAAELQRRGWIVVEP
jgi:hypothetical protein